MTDITRDPAEWLLITDEWVGKEHLWEHKDHRGVVFSTDAGITYYRLDEPTDSEGNPRIHSAAERPWADLSEAVFTSLGTASTCWENMNGAGVFDDVRAKEAGDRLVAWINEHYERKATRG